MPESKVRAQTPWLVKYAVNPIMLLTGGVPTLTVRGRRTGKAIRTPINVLDLEGTRYLTSPRGETGWSRNLRVTREAWLKERGAERRYRAEEIPPEARAPIIAAYLARWGAQTRAEFAKLPDPTDHPIFKLQPVD